MYRSVPDGLRLAVAGVEEFGIRMVLTTLKAPDEPNAVCARAMVAMPMARNK